MSNKGPAEGCATGITPAACKTLDQYACSGGENAMYHQLNDVDAEMLVYHGAESGGRLPKLSQQLSVRSVNDEFNSILKRVARQHNMRPSDRILSEVTYLNFQFFGQLA